jgi:hypothetical protein
MSIVRLAIVLVFLFLLTFTQFLYADGQKLTAENLDSARRAAAWRSRRIIMNNDGNDSRRAKEKTRKAFLDSRSTALVGSQVDAIFYCDGIWGSFTHKSPTSDLRVGSDKGYKEWAAELDKDGGPDPLGTIVDFGHKNDMEVFWSLRMNDTHDASDPSMMSKWKKENRDCLVGTFEHRREYKGAGRRWSGVDYSKKKVQDRTVGWFDEVAGKYDIDGFELDFFRHLVFFKNPLHGSPATSENCRQMTEVLRRIRKIADAHALRRGRPILLAIRVPDSIEYCKEAGLDVERWLKEGLVDMMIVTGYFRLSRWEKSVELGHRFDVPVYAGLSESRIKKPPRNFKNSPEEYRARALAAWKAGVDGVYTFNLFNPSSSVFSEIGDPAALMDMDKIYTTGSRSVKGAQYWVAGGLRYLAIPYPLPDRSITVSAEKPSTVVIDIWDDLGSQSSKMGAIVRFLLTGGLEKPSQLEVSLNGHRLKTGTFNQDGCIACEVPGDYFKIGENRFTFKLTSKVSKKVLLRDLIVSVEKKK